MKKSDLTPGTAVLASVNDEEWGDSEVIKYVHNEYDDYTLTGVVVDKPASDGKVVVLWDENDWDYEEEEVEIKLLTLAEDRSAIEKEFKNLSKEIKEKMKEAARLVNEAGKLAKQAHAKSLESMWDATGPLINAMDNNGWRSSSWGC
jgi:hypothetical protein